MPPPMHFAFGGERECKNASPLSSNASAASNHLAFAPPLGTEGGAAVHHSRRHGRKGPALEAAAELDMLTPEDVVWELYCGRTA